MRARLWLVTALMLTTTATLGAETATQALARLPPLAAAASAGMDCSAEDVTARKVEAVLRPMSTTPMSYGGSVANMTPAQMQAMAALSDPAFNECVTQLQSNPGELWAQPMKEKLQAKLDQIHGELIKANEAHCRAQKSEACMPDPTILKRFNAQTTAAGTQFLKDAQPQYAKFSREVGDCVGKRDAAMAGASGGGGSAVDAIFASNTGVTWGLVNLPAAVNTSLCKAARDAAQKYVEPPQ